MQTSIDYLNHVNIAKGLNLYTNLNKTQREYEDRFETIYQKARDADISLESAKEFLSTLSKEEQITLQKFEGLAELFDTESLSNEGAYNLLLHRYEKFDWNSDGSTEIGSAKTLPLLPQNMDINTKKAWVDTLNTMGDDMMAIGVISMTLNEEHLKRQLAERFDSMSEDEKAQLQKQLNFDLEQFITDTLNKPYTLKEITHNDILNTTKTILDGADGGYSSPEMINSTIRLQEEFQKAYQQIEPQTYLTTQEQIKIQQDSDKTINTKEETPLQNALKETRTPEEIIAEYRAVQGGDGIAYDGMFEEIQANFLAKHEPYFQSEYEHYEKYKDVFTPLYSNFTIQKANAIAQELNAQFPHYKDVMHKAYYGGTEKDKQVWQDMFMDYQAYNRYLREKHDLQMSPTALMGGLNKESTKAYNLAVYDALEEGLSIEEASNKAKELLSMFGGREALAFKLMFFTGLPNNIEEVTKIPEEEVDYDKQIDLRKEGFNHNFWTESYLNKFKSDEHGILARIMYDLELFSFLMDNEELLDKKLAELKDRAYQSDSGKEWYDDKNSDGMFNERFKASIKSKYEKALYAKEIYDKYSEKIFDNIKIDGFSNK
jgi:hypothetical protein